MKFKRSLARIALLLSIVSVGVAYDACAQQTAVAFDSGSFMLYASAAKTVPLTGGSSTVDGDGAVLQLGYYSTATTSNLFSGTFIALTGQTSLNTAYNTTSIGDARIRNAGTGTFALNLSFTPGNLTTGNNLPVTGTPLAIRFFNNTTIATSTAFNAVGDVAWLWQAPAIPGPTVTISLDDANLQWLGGATTAFYTSQPIVVVPEPSSFVLGGVGCVGLLWILQRRRMTATA